MKIRTLIVDDEAPARARLRQMLKTEVDFEIVGECANGRQAIASIQKGQPDLMFLDVQMPRVNGFDVCEALSNEQRPIIIFVTAYDQYALRAFEVHAIDYLLKPFDRDRFQKTLRRVREQLTRGQQNSADVRLANLLQEIKNAGARPERLAFKVEGKVIFVRPDEIHWIEADGNYVRLNTAAGVHHLRDTLSRFEQQLPADRFMRISRSVLVNLDCIKELQPMFYGDYAVLLQDGTRLSLSRNFRDRIEKLLAKFR